MAKEGSPASVGERAMFASGGAPFALPVVAPNSSPSPRKAQPGPASEPEMAASASLPPGALAPWRFDGIGRLLPRVLGEPRHAKLSRSLTGKAPVPSRAAVAQSRPLRRRDRTRQRRRLHSRTGVPGGGRADLFFARPRARFPAARCRRRRPWRRRSLEPGAAGHPYGADRCAALRPRWPVRQGRNLARRHKNARRRGDDAAFRQRRRGRAFGRRQGAAHHRRHRHRAPRPPLRT